MWTEGVAALAKLGFSTDGSQGNYRTTFESPGPESFRKVADFLLTALYQVHDASFESTIIVNMAHDRQRKIETCDNLPSG
ncbi:hypothetical protein CU100_07630 [Phyllobacterium endophyticum]|uniref:Uncharacterized protein n=1 Tax=Phyllobacterium endophyticum TaxID=1149773 RepID=A0A2P7B228_9HYPH|nr:hypothetical protein CU100_07630 [Phyllobacterium endophyticum]